MKPFLCFPGPCVKMILTGNNAENPDEKQKEAHYEAELLRR